MSTRPLLEAHIDEAGDKISRELQRLERDLESLRRDMEKALVMLQGQIEPLRKAYAILQQALSGTEIGESYSATSAPPSLLRAAWDGWKQRLGKKEGEIIDVLIHGERLTWDQLRIALHCGYSTLQSPLKRMQELGLLRRDGSKYYLKTL